MVIDNYIEVLLVTYLKVTANDKPSSAIKGKNIEGFCAMLGSGYIYSY